MLEGHGWCVIRSSREVYRNANVNDVDTIDKGVSEADVKLWDDFLEWLEVHACHFLKYQFIRSSNNHEGIFHFFISRNHRSSMVWEMIEWIASHGPSSYGLFYVFDDEDVHEVDAEYKQYPRFQPPKTYDYSNVFRVHRIVNGEVIEMGDPFFGPITPNIDPPHPYNYDEDE